MDFYTSSITIEVDGVDIAVKVDSNHLKSTKSKADAELVPNTVDLAQSFLETEPQNERALLEKALAAENQDLAASIASTDDGSEDELPLGTGAPLTLPGFLSNFLQGILDRMQISIKNISFQLQVEVPLEPNSTVPESVSFKIALDDISIEGVTATSPGSTDESNAKLKKGTRHVCIDTIRAYLVSEANLFSSFSRSTSAASSAAFPPSLELSQLDSNRDSSSIPNSLEASQEMMGTATSALQQDIDDDDGLNSPLGDSEIALGIPYELPDNDDGDLDSPQTPRASIYHELDTETPLANLQPASQKPPPGLIPAFSSSGSDMRAMFASQQIQATELPTPEAEAHSAPESDDQDTFSDASEDLTESRVYSHEEASSMYMSAMSQRDAPQKSLATLPASSDLDAPAVNASDEPVQPPAQRRVAMPGAWGEESMIGESMQASTHSPSVLVGDNSTTLPDRLPENDNEAEPEPAADIEDAPTPKGPTRVMKQILYLKTLSLYLPSNHENATEPQETSTADGSQSLYQSVYPQAPGAFSVHGQKGSPSAFSPEAGSVLPAVESEPMEIQLSPMTINFDSSLVFLLINVVRTLTAALKLDPEADKPTAVSPPSDVDTTTKGQPPVKFVLEKLSINFLNRLVGIADRPGRSQDAEEPFIGQDILLNLTLQQLAAETSTVSLKPTKPGAKLSNAVSTMITVQKFRFGYAVEDIISFDSGRPMSTSIRDTFLSEGTDIAIKMLQTADGMRTEIETLPLAIQIELQKLDETFSWFGGLSSFLNMSTSAAMLSPTKSTAVLPPKPQPRGVHFDAPINPDDKSVAAANKINVRIGGAFVELLGKECSINAETNAIKLVSRDEGIGMACSMMRVSGPYLKNSMADPSITVELGGTRLDFLNAPKTTDLEKLLELIIPSKVRYDHTTDEIMVDTLLRQRRKGSVLRVGVDMVNIRVKNMAQLTVLPNLGEELAKLSTVAKYLPEDDRPGILTLAKVHKIAADVDFGGGIGRVGVELRNTEVGQISIPSLVAVVVQDISVLRNGSEELVTSVSFGSAKDMANRAPSLMVRMIGDEIEPIIKLKLHNLQVEYRVPTIMDLLGLSEESTPQDFDESLAASVANLGGQAHTALGRQSPTPSPNSKHDPPIKLDIGFQDCLIGLNPLKLDSKMVIALTDARLEVTLPKNGVMRTELNINKTSILLIDDASNVGQEAPPGAPRTRYSASASPQVVDMCARGFVDICYMSSALVVVNVQPGPDGKDQVEVEVRDDLLVLETCADSTQTLITLANALKPPTPPSKENKYKTNIVPVQDLLASISAEAFGQSEGDYDFDQDFAGAQEMARSDSEIGSEMGGSPLRVEPKFYRQESGEELFDATKMSSLSRETSMEETLDGVLLTGFDASSSQRSVDSEGLDIHDDFFSKAPAREETVKVWNSNNNTYDDAPPELVRMSPIKVNVRDVHLIWNLFDGYDWVHTRNIITKAVEEVEHRALERQARGTATFEEEEEDETIGDFLFNSIYIGIPANRDPNDLSRAINEGLNDNATETESVATTAYTNTTSRTARRLQPRPRKLRLNRSKRHKITFELQGVNIDMVMFPPEGAETLSSIDVRVQNLDIFDHVPTSTWKKFATYDQDRGEREMGTSMVHLEILTVKPLPQLGASETVLRVTVLPLRLHVDQDALDFITRFFEFKDESIPVHSSPSDVPFVQRAEVNSIPVKLDFKPKRVDYAGLRSGHTTEFMNFIVLEESRLVLRHAIIYGITGFDKLGNTLKAIWTPDVTNNQLPGVIAGLAPVRSLANIGGGFKDLVEIPIREYKKDGRVIRSISKGAAAFARGTGTEIIKFGAKLAVGTQYALQGAEGLLAQQQGEAQWDEDDLDEEDKKQISLYADQPTGVIQGIRGGYRSMVRDMNMAKDAIIAVPGEVMQSQSAAGVAQAVLKRAPTIVFRPAMGVTKVIGKTLMGATNTIDPHNRRRVEEVRLVDVVVC